MRFAWVALVVAGCDDTIFRPHDGGPGATDTGAVAEGWCGVQSVLNRNCLACHSAGSSIGGLDLETDPYAALVNVPSLAYPSVIRVVPSDPDGSFLVAKLEGTGAGGIMPPTGELSESDIQLVRDWIADGASDVCESPTTTGGTVNRYHPDGWAEPEVHGLATKLQTETDCRTCHGDDLEGGSVGISCTSCHDEGWETNCTFCHGDPVDGTGAPPEDIDDNTFNATLSFPPHRLHIESPLHATWDCTECHTKPSSLFSYGHLLGDPTPGVAEVTFTGGLSSLGTYEGNGSCSNLYCHGNGRGDNGDVVVTDGAGCDDCHNQDQLSGYHDEHIGEDGIGCSDCHDTVNAAEQIVLPEQHVNRMVDLDLPPSIDKSGNKCTGACHEEDHESHDWYTGEDDD